MDAADAKSIAYHGLRRSRAAVSRYLRLCVMTSLDTGAGEVVFLVGAPLGGFSVWSRSSDDNGPGDDPPPNDDGNRREWDWERFERELSDCEARRIHCAPDREGAPEQSDDAAHRGLPCYGAAMVTIKTSSLRSRQRRR